MKIYIAGPVFGYPNNNREAFEAAVLEIHDAWGYGVVTVNPLDIPPHEHPGTTCPTTYPAGSHDAACEMRSDLEALLDCDAIYLLKGWEHSRGANAEFAVAKALGMTFYYEGRSL